jgi:hypothetical protein
VSGSTEHVQMMVPTGDGMLRITDASYGRAITAALLASGPGNLCAWKKSLRPREMCTSW